VLLVHAALLGPALGGYQVRQSGSGNPLRWPLGPIDVEIALDAVPEGVDAGDAARAAELAFEEYRTALSPMQTGIELDVRRGDRAAVSAGDRIATVTWVVEGWDDDYDPEALAITVTSYDPTSGRIQDADIVINRDHHWSAGEGCSMAYDLQGVLAHEVGHLFGLGHDTEDDEATMFPSAGPCETKKRDLAASDLEGLHFLYVESMSPPPPLACNAVPGGRGGAGALLFVAGALAVALRRRAVAVAALVLALAAPAGATTIRSVGLQAAGKAATVVARGVVRGVEVRLVGDRIYTDAEIAVLECVKGRCGASLVVRQLGGELDGEGVTVAGSARLDAGAEVVLMLRPRRDGAWAPVGMAQGVYRVERDAAGAPKALVRDTRELILVGETGAERGAIEKLRYEALRAIR
jgi:hypothetical protein